MKAYLFYIPFFTVLLATTGQAETPGTVKITISPETTYAVEPRLPDGRIDYYAAANRENSRGVKPENNQAAGLLQLVPCEMEYPLLRDVDDPEKLRNPDSERTFRERYWKLLGFNTPPPLEKLESIDPGMDMPGRDFLKELREVYTFEQIRSKIEALKESDRRSLEERFKMRLFDKEQYAAELKKINDEAPTEFYRRILYAEWRSARREIWTEKDYPYLARRVSLTDELTRKLIEVSKRTDCYVPIVRTGDEINLYDKYKTLLPYGQSARNTARFFQYRGNWDFGRGNYDQAFQCAFSLTRIGRTMRKGAGFAIEELVADAIEGVGNGQVVKYLLDSGNMKDAAWLLDRKREFDAIYPTIGPLPVLPKWALGERYEALSSVQSIAFDRDAFKRSLKEVEESGGDMPVHLKAFDRFYDPKYDYDWDRVLRLLNKFIDEYEGNLTVPGFPSRLQATERFEERTRKNLQKMLEDPGTVGDREEQLADCFSSVYLPYTNRFVWIQCRREWDHRVTSLVFALAAYRADHGGDDPDTLEQLVPEYVDAIPDSPFTERPLRYVKRTNDCLVPNDDHWKFDGSEPGVEKAIAEGTPGGCVFPDARHFLFIVRKEETGPEK